MSIERVQVLQEISKVDEDMKKAKETANALLAKRQQLTNIGSLSVAWKRRFK